MATTGPKRKVPTRKTPAGKAPTRVGLMGFGQIGRQIYDLSTYTDDIEIVAIADIGAADILHYLLVAETKQPERFSLEGNFLHNGRSSARMMPIDSPAEMPWDAFDVDLVIEATGKFRSMEHLEHHVRNGAPRVLLRTLPLDTVDRILVPGVNIEQAEVNDRYISAGSATTNALALMLKIIGSQFELEYASMTTVHAYSSDQPVQDYAGSDFRRSRSAAENIIPNTHEAGMWIGRILPQYEGRVITSALNVPVQRGNLIDLNLVMADAGVSAEDINDSMRSAAATYTGIMEVCEDPIVSSDVIGSTLSLLFDAPGTIKSGSNIIKALGWYENTGHAARILDITRHYAQLDAASG